MLRFSIPIILRLILILVFLAPAVMILPRLVTSWGARNLIFSIEKVPPKPVAIVFGAGLWRDGTPTPVLRDRVATAVELYFSGKVKKLLMSGDNSHHDYNEPAAMRAYAMQLGVSAEDIVLDYAGRRTYDTCYRAREIFRIEEVILVTQDFHLPRALYTCNALGVHAMGVSADRRVYRRRSLVVWNLRELPASLVALWQVHISQPLPILGQPVPIFPLEAQ
jgi:SanA protein